MIMRDRHKETVRRDQKLYRCDCEGLPVTFEDAMVITGKTTLFAYE